MNHRDIQDRNLVELYVTRRLSDDDAVRFEEHFVDCPQCLDQIEVAERLGAAMKRTAVRKPSRPEVSIGTLAAAAAILLISGLSLWQYVRANKLESELVQVRAVGAEWKSRFETEVANVRRTQAAAPLVASTFALNLSRSSQNAGAAPPNRIIMANGAEWVVLTLDRDWEPGFETFQARLSGATTLWQQDGLVALPGTPLSVAVPAALLPSGDFVLEIEGRPAKSTSLQSLGRYRFRVARP